MSEVRFILSRIIYRDCLKKDFSSPNNIRLNYGDTRTELISQSHTLLSGHLIMGQNRVTFKGDILIKTSSHPNVCLESIVHRIQESLSVHLKTTEEILSYTQFYMFIQQQYCCLKRKPRQLYVGSHGVWCQLPRSIYIPEQLNGQSLFPAE